MGVEGGGGGRVQETFHAQVLVSVLKVPTAHALRELSHRLKFQLQFEKNELALILPLFREDQKADSGYGGYRA